MSVLHVKLGTGETHEIEFTPESVLTVVNRELADQGAIDRHSSFTDVVAVSLADGKAKKS